MSDLAEKQVKFWALLGVLTHFATTLSYQLVQAEGYIGDSIDKPTEDTPHKRNGQHFRRLAQDLVLRVGGEVITDGSHPAWLRLGLLWEALDPDCRWGGRFTPKDSNHFSLTYGGFA